MDALSEDLLRIEREGQSQVKNFIFKTAILGNFKNRKT